MEKHKEKTESSHSPDTLAIAAIKDAVHGKQLSLQGIAELRQRVEDVIDGSLRGRYAPKVASVKAD